MDDSKTLTRSATPSDWRQLGELLWKWDPLGIEPPRDEYDCLVPPVLRALEQGEKEEAVAAVLAQKLQQHFDATVDSSEIVRFAAGTVKWFASPSEPRLER